MAMPVVGEFRRVPVQSFGAFGERAQDVEFGHRAGGVLERLQSFGERIEQRLIQRTFAHQ